MYHDKNDKDTAALILIILAFVFFVIGIVGAGMDSISYSRENEINHQGIESQKPEKQQENNDVNEAEFLILFM